MKKAYRLLLLAAVAFLATGCFSIMEAVLETEEQDAAIICVDDTSYNITVTVDRNQHHIKTVKIRDLDRKRNLKRAAENMIYVSPGSHQVTVRRNGRVIYDERIRVSGDETKLIYL